MTQLIANFFRGTLMGAADIIPGVSGGTVALILGIYTRLVTAISRLDRALLRDLFSGRWRSAAAHVDFGFLVSLGAGVFLGILMLARVIHVLMENDTSRPLTWAAFFGMIAASAVLVARLIRVKSPDQLVTCLLVGALGAGVAFGLTMLGALSESTAAPSLAYLFACGTVAICAMILPGISGAHIMLVLGVYFYVTGIIKELPEGSVTGEGMVALIVFAMGCATGLIGFSKVLRWLLKEFHAVTMSGLCGFMIGALRKVWPFQLDTTPATEEFKYKTYEPFLPATFGQFEWLAMGVIFLSFFAVLVIDWVAQRRKTNS